MASFGSALRSTRLGRGISLDDVARDTRLTKRCLQALEDESIPELPGEPYNRAYLRTYSAYLGLDPDDLVSDYEREAEAQTKTGRLVGRPDVLTAMRQAVERRPLAVVGNEAPRSDRAHCRIGRSRRHSPRRLGVGGRDPPLAEQRTRSGWHEHVVDAGERDRR